MTYMSYLLQDTQLFNFIDMLSTQQHTQLKKNDDKNPIV